jgi:hypothetical protein
VSIDESARHVVTLDDFDSQNFTGVPEAAAILGGCDPRTVRAEIKAGRIPATRVGARWLVPVAWLREQVLGGCQPAQPTTAAIDVDQLADRVADRLVARFADVFRAMAPTIKNASGPAGIRAEGADRRGGPNVHHNSAA